MVPIIELRGAIPVGIAMGLNPVLTFLLSILGNLLPVPFILLFIRMILDWMKDSRFFWGIPAKVANWLFAKADKHRGAIEKYATFGLFLFVAIPLPGTGAWTGALVAALFGMSFKKAILSITCGVLTAGIIMTLACTVLREVLTFLL